MIIEAKLFEIRDRATSLLLLSTKIRMPENYGNLSEVDTITTRMLRKAGYSFGQSYIFVKLVSSGLSNAKDFYDRYSAHSSGRTFGYAYEVIEQSFEDLCNGDVIDVEYSLGEAEEPKVAEYTEYESINQAILSIYRTKEYTILEKKR